MKLVLGRQNPTFSVQAVQLRADITYSKATVSVIIDERGLNKYARDYINEIDELSFAIGKNLLTYQQAVEEIAEIAVSKPFSDSYTPEDAVELMIGFNRAFADAVGTSDFVTAFGVTKLLVDQIASLEALSYSLSKVLSDSVVVIDNADANSGDGLEYTEVKPSSDAAGATDLAVSAVFKLLADAVALTEILQVVVEKLLTDAVNATEQAYLAVGRPVSDAVSVVDVFDRVFDANRSVSDSVAQIEALAFDSTKPATDTYSAADVFERVFVAYLSQSESVNQTDSQVFDSTKLLTHSTAATDVFDRVFTALLTASDSTLTLDVLASIDVSKLLTDAANAVSSGSLRMTDYADITYFAEDYVGSTRTFS